ncbi:MAG: RHS repeat-associated core domain-containing protein, partial [Acidobacteriota bacterium]
SYRFASTRTYTQEDPIGLAGGLNLYGFANGDPVNFSDPFGLMPDCKGFFGCVVEFLKFEARGFAAGADVRNVLRTEDEGQFGFLAGRLSLAFATPMHGFGRTVVAAGAAETGSAARISSASRGRAATSL